MFTIYTYKRSKYLKLPMLAVSKILQFTSVPDTNLYNWSLQQEVIFCNLQVQRRQIFKIRHFNKQAFSFYNLLL